MCFEHSVEELFEVLIGAEVGDLQFGFLVQER